MNNRYRALQQFFNWCLEEDEVVHAPWNGRRRSTDLGSVRSRLIDRLQQPGLRKSFQASMRNLEDLVVAEGTDGPALDGS